MPHAQGSPRDHGARGDLRDAPKGKAPTFMVAALKNPIGANLDRIQIVEGWLDRRGELQEKVYDVVWSTSGHLVPTATCRPWATPSTCPTPLTATRLAIQNSSRFGAIRISTPGLRAFYSAHVIEISTPRWTAYDAKCFKVKMPPEVPMTILERAYTSPIWYTPRS